jgi:hypothetical protein
MIFIVPEAFVQPNDFIPERWTTKPELCLDARAYAPFGVGMFKHFVCAFIIFIHLTDQ